MKWSGTVLCLIGIALTAMNIYPLNLIFGFSGSLLWSVVGIRSKDWALFVVEFAAVMLYFIGLFMGLAK